MCTILCKCKKQTKQQKQKRILDIRLDDAPEYTLA